MEGFWVLLEDCCALCADIPSSLSLYFIYIRGICYTSFIFNNTFSNVMPGTFVPKYDVHESSCFENEINIVNKAMNCNS